MQAAKAGQIDLVIMDVGLPDIDGREAVRILRRNGFKAPIIMLTGLKAPIPTPSSASNWALTIMSPSPSALPCCLRASAPSFASTRRSRTRSSTIGPYTFGPSPNLVNPKGSKVRLTEKETSVLRYLYRAGQRPVSRETLLQQVWGYNSELRRTRSRRTSI